MRKGRGIVEHSVIFDFGTPSCRDLLLAPFAVSADREIVHRYICRDRRKPWSVPGCRAAIPHDGGGRAAYVLKRG